MFACLKPLKFFSGVWQVICKLSQTMFKYCTTAEKVAARLPTATANLQ